jgi:hypothetical protein
VVVAVELSRLLRRALLVAGIAVTGWLVSIVFAGTAAADNDPGVTEPATPETQQQSGGLLGGLLGGVTNTLTGLTNTVVQLTGSVLDTTTSVLAPVVPPSPEPIIDLPALLPLPSHGSSGSSQTDRSDAPQAAPVVVTPAPPQPAPPAPQPVEVAVVRPAEPPAPPPAPVTAAADNKDSPADEHANRGGSDPQPVKAPAAPAGPGSTVSPTHDSSGGARGTHGVLTTQATLHPADAGFTTRSRAVDAAGRDAGLPASSPD